MAEGVEIVLALERRYEPVSESEEELLAFFSGGKKGKGEGEEEEEDGASSGAE